MSHPDTIMSPTVSRAPKGCNRPVMTHLTETERQRLESIAELEMRSLSATSRLLMIKGIEQYDAETEQAARS
ncbi:hypothetical protein C8E00_103485 [Chromohalobacter marismortui]|jgi:hypothetical protein|uniref:Uncharacterized protein n=2 Tax=Chromohalobacter TaxID=42054 RepID=Q1QXU0_CHRI1|nr:hypothetical protein [Chromohalobacter]ABE58718.1 hypothetical protein Csal_1363 [Chromohalobacter salexigens DSM 3043]MCI0508634.1 hypothetical protein [Chromohalobacter sp.]MDO0944830.1 hypothetical protein [Chromohalobacter salexigens]TDU23111.1 hypothetical protein C8E00_103485 [Chromohalobacter marismortui]